MAGTAEEYVAFLLLGVIAVVVDGQVIYRSGRAQLQDVYETPAAAESANRLVSVFFHLVMLGLLALISTLDIGGDALLPRVITKLGLLLLLVAAGHAAATLALSSMRERQRQARRAEELAVQRRHHQSPTVHPEPADLYRNEHNPPV